MSKKKELTIRNNTVVKANELIQKSRFSLTVQQQKIVLYLISQIQPQDEDFRLYEFSIPEFCRATGIDATSGENYKDLKKAIQEIRDKSIWITLEDGSMVTLSWIEKAKIKPQSGKIEIRLDQDMKPFLLQLKKNFTQYELIWTLHFKSKYTIRLYELIKSVHYNELETYEREFDVKQLCQAMGAEGYKQFCAFHSRALKPAVKEINEYSDKSLIYDLIKQGRTVEKIKFTIKTKAPLDRMKIRSEIEQELGLEQMTFFEKD